MLSDKLPQTQGFEILSFKELPILLLCAGKGSRMSSEAKGLHKSLVPLRQGTPGSLELLIRTFNRLRISSIYVVVGHKKEQILEKLESLTVAYTDLIPIDAADEYEDGPLYSFLSAKDHLVSMPLFAILPADTIFHPALFDTLRNIEYNAGYCYVFYYTTAQEPNDHDLVVILGEDNRVLRVEEYYKMADRNHEFGGQYHLFIPFLVLNGYFFLYAEIGKEQGKTKLIEMIKPYIRSTKKFLAYEVTGAEPYFVDLDQPEDFEKLDRVLR